MNFSPLAAFGWTLFRLIQIEINLSAGLPVVRQREVGVLVALPRIPLKTLLA